MMSSRQSLSSEHSPGSPQRGGPEFLVIGKLRRPHGVKGELLMEVLTDFPERIQVGMTVYLGEQYLPVQINNIRIHVNALLVSINGYDDRESAGELRNLEVYIPSSSVYPLPDGEFYHHQIIGLQVMDDTDTLLGYVTEILVTGANDVLIVKAENGGEYLIPVIEGVVTDIDLARNRITIHPLPGLIPE